LARIIALDWDSREFHLVEATVGRSKVQVHRAIHWREEEAFAPASAEAFGQRLRERLKSAGIAPSPLVVGLGRERLVMKEVRFPDVGQEIEASIVRNQIVKELTEAPEDVFFDYAPMAEASKNGQRRALSVVVRKDVVQGIQTASQVAGLKLVAVTARPFGIAACFNHLAGATPKVPAPPTSDAVSAVLTVAEGWAEFCAVRGQQLVYSRAATPGDGLIGEVRRNLAAYSGQPQLTFPRDAIQSMYVAGNGDNLVLREALRDTLGIPVHGMDPFAADSHVQIEGGNKAGFTGAVGLLHLWGKDQTTPVNFVKPREIKVAADPHKRRVIGYSVAGAVTFIGLVVAGWMMTEARQKEVNVLNGKKAELEKMVKDIQPELKYLEALREFAGGSISWLDELYDLAARAPLSTKETKFRVTSITATSLGTLTVAKAAKDAKNNKDKERVPKSAQMVVKIVVPRKDAYLVKQLEGKINMDRHSYVSAHTITTQNISDPLKATEEHVLKIDLARQAPEKYTELISIIRRRPIVDTEDLDDSPPGRFNPNGADADIDNNRDDGNIEEAKR
jgi:Tfp pilus assembly PilM family ATPase